MPKIGFSNHDFRTVYQIVNLGAIATRGLEGVVGPEELARVGLIRKAEARVKVLGGGEFGQALTIRAHSFSKSAVARLTAAGGTAEVI